MTTPTPASCPLCTAKPEVVNPSYDPAQDTYKGIVPLPSHDDADIGTFMERLVYWMRMCGVSSKSIETLSSLTPQDCWDESSIGTFARRFHCARAYGYLFNAVRNLTTALKHTFPTSLVISEKDLRTLAHYRGFQSIGDTWCASHVAEWLKHVTDPALCRRAHAIYEMWPLSGADMANVRTWTQMRAAWKSKLPDMHDGERNLSNVLNDAAYACGITIYSGIIMDSIDLPDSKESDCMPILKGDVCMWSTEELADHLLTWLVNSHAWLKRSNDLSGNPNLEGRTLANYLTGHKISSASFINSKHFPPITVDIRVFEVLREIVQTRSWGFNPSAVASSSLERAAIESYHNFRDSALITHERCRQEGIANILRKMDNWCGREVEAEEAGDAEAVAEAIRERVHYEKCWDIFISTADQCLMESMERAEQFLHYCVTDNSCLYPVHSPAALDTLEALETSLLPHCVVPAFPRAISTWTSDTMTENEAPCVFDPLLPTRMHMALQMSIVDLPPLTQACVIAAVLQQHDA